MPAVKSDFLADPLGLTEDHADPLDETNTDPPHPSDMRYQRWYASGVVLPINAVLILSGTDQDTSLGPPGSQFFPPCASTQDSAGCSKVRYTAPEVYFPETDTTLALESAGKLLNMYPRSYVVQTGPGWDDWKVAVTSEASGDFLPGLSTIGQYDPWFYDGNTYLLDVQAALADPDRDTPGTSHWEFVDQAQIAHDGGAGAQLWKLDSEGRAISQRVVLFGGSCGRVPRGESGEPLFECDRSTVEMIDYESASPTWEQQAPLIKPASQNNAVVLPNGKVVIVGGATGRGPWDNTFHLQMFDPEMGTITPLVETQVARHDHSTVALLPDGSVAILGGNATDLSGEVDHLDAGIPVAQIYRPSYLMGGPRPVIDKVQDNLRYGKLFKIRVSAQSPIASVAIIRMGPVTHNWDWGNRYAELAITQVKHGSVLSVRAPAAPGLAVPGHYQLFVVDENGIPSEAAVVHLGHDE